MARYYKSLQIHTSHCMTIRYDTFVSHGDKTEMSTPKNKKHFISFCRLTFMNIWIRFILVMKTGTQPTASLASLTGMMNHQAA